MKFDIRIIRSIYYHLAALIGLVVFVIGAVGMVNFGVEYFLNTTESDYSWEFENCRNLEKQALSKEVINNQPESVQGEKRVELQNFNVDQCLDEARKRVNSYRVSDIKRRLAAFLPAMFVGFLVWIFHWKGGKKD